jgi:hypothetical protein
MTPIATFERATTPVGVLAAIALGLSAGAMLAEGAVLVPYWRSLAPESFLAWYAANAARLLGFFGPLEIASAALAVVAATLQRYGSHAGSGSFVVAAALAIGVLATFPLYFQDVNAQFAAGTIASDRVAAELRRWSAWHWVRTAIGTAAFVAALLGCTRERT